MLIIQTINYCYNNTNKPNYSKNNSNNLVGGKSIFWRCRNYTLTTNVFKRSGGRKKIRIVEEVASSIRLGSMS